MLRDIDAQGMQVDVVLHNAGLQIAYRTDYMTTPDADYETSFVVNTIAPMRICYHLPGMIARWFGRVVNTTPAGSILNPSRPAIPRAKQH